MLGRNSPMVQKFAVSLFNTNFGLRAYPELTSHIFGIHFRL